MTPPPTPNDFRKQTCWNALTGVSLAVILALAVGAILLISHILGFLEPVLLPVIVAAVIAYLLEPLVNWLVRRKISRPLAVSGVMGACALAIVIFLLGIVPPLVHQTNELVDNRAQIWQSASNAVFTAMEKPMVAGAIDKFYRKSLRDMDSDAYSPEELQQMRSATTPQQQLTICMDLNASRFFTKITSWLTSGSEAVFGWIGIAIGLVMTPIFLFYFLTESSSIKEHWHDVLPIKESRFKEEVVSTVQEINGYIISFLRGQMLVSLIDGALTAVILYFIGLPYAFTIGAAVAILGIIPYLGTIITVVPATLIAWFVWHDWQHILLVIGIFTAVNQFDGWVIQPKIVGNSVGLHPLTVMFSVLFWTLVLGGILGALLAVPLTAALKVIFRRYIWQSMKDSSPTTSI